MLLKLDDHGTGTGDSRWPSCLPEYREHGIEGVPRDLDMVPSVREAFVKHGGDRVLKLRERCGHRFSCHEVLHLEWLFSTLNAHSCGLTGHPLSNAAVAPPRYGQSRADNIAGSNLPALSAHGGLSLRAHVQPPKAHPSFIPCSVEEAGGMRGGLNRAPHCRLHSHFRRSLSLAGATSRRAWAATPAPLAVSAARRGPRRVFSRRGQGACKRANTTAPGPHS